VNSLSDFSIFGYLDFALSWQFEKKFCIIIKQIIFLSVRRKKHKSGSAAQSLFQDPPPSQQPQDQQIPATANGSSKLESEKKTASLSSLHQMASSPTPPQISVPASYRFSQNGTLKPGQGSGK